MTSQKESVERFAAWLEANGAEILPTTNQWELIRYKTKHDGLCVAYVNAKGRRSFPGKSAEHYAAFEKGVHLDRVSRPRRDQKDILLDQVIERDGPVCCLCGQFLNGDQTLEHWLNVSHGGNNHISNAGAAHTDCNTLMGNFAISKKINLRDRFRADVAVTPPWEFLDANTWNTRTTGLHS